MVKLQSKRTIKLPEIFVSSSFFIYAFHEPYYDQIRKVLFKFILPLSNDSFYMDIQMATYYVLTPIIYIVILIIIFLFIRHHLPRIAKILSGNRL